MISNARQHLGILQIFSGLASLEGLLAVAQLLSLPGGAERRLPWLTPGRLILLLPAVLLTLAFLWLLYASWHNPVGAGRQVSRLANVLHRNWVYWVALILCSLVFLVCFYFLLLNWKDRDPYVRSYLARLAPFALWIVFISLQSAILLRWLRYGSDTSVFGPWRTALMAAFVAFVLSLLLSTGVVWTKIGLKPDIVAWGEPGVPILPGQIGGALVITFSVALLGSFLIAQLRKTERFSKSALIARSIDLFACLCLWGIAVWRWGVEPLRPSYFSPAPVPPNQEYYPYSDAAMYDSSAQSLIIGYGLGETVRPLYSFFLALAQTFNGIGYQNALAWQIPLLALIPALLYLLARTLHNQLSGFFVGLLAVLRESNSIALADVTNVSHVKLLMSDVPTSLGVLAITAVIVLWMAKPGSRKAYPLLAGGLLALAMLVRVQVLVLLPVILLAVWLASRRDGQAWTNAALMAGGFLVVLLPWLWRNWQASGQVVLSETSQTSQIGLIGQRYSLNIDEQGGGRLPGEADDAYVNRMLTSALGFVREHPAETARFQAAHFLHNEIDTLLVLPSDFTLANFLTEYTDGVVLRQDPNAPAVWERCCSLRAYVKHSGFWGDWGGELPVQSGLTMLASLFLISVGIGTAWRGGGGAGLLPLVVNAAYTMSNALVRNSGWRFNLPVDWVGYLYYGIGLVQLCLWGWAFFRNSAMSIDASPSRVEIGQNSKSRITWRQVALAGGLLFIVSAAIPIAERAIPERFRDVDVRSVLAGLQEKGALKPVGVDGQTLASFLSQDKAEALIGRSLYPRFHLAGEGEPGSGWPSYAPRDYNRLGFYLIGARRRQVILRVPSAPSYFPNASDVLVLGCSQGDYLDAYLVIILDAPDEALVRSPMKGWICPEP